MLTLLRLLLLAANDVQCPACRFWYDPRYGHACVPC